MTDKEKLVALLTEWGVGFNNENSADNGSSEVIVGYYDNPYEAGDKITGYSGFYTSFNFDKDEKFIEMGAWE